MSVVEYRTDDAKLLPIVSEQAVGARTDVTPIRYRGWVLLALGLGSWAGLFKVFGWL